MQLQFLGTGGFHPNERRHTASLLLPDIGVALDAGSGFFRIPGRLRTKSLDIFLTHAHLDHVCGLSSILVAMLREEITPVRVFGSEQTLTAVRKHLLAAELFPVELNFEWNVLIGPVVLPDGSRLTWIPLAHPGGSIGFRIDWSDRSLAYITDTTAPGGYSEFIRDVDVLIHECYFPDSLSDWAEKTGHSSASRVALLAKSAGAKRLVLVHVDPERADDDPVGMDSVQKLFPGAELAEDLTEIEF
jgi:ribonuclease Z